MSHKISEHKTILLLLFISVFLGGYFLFFTSNIWYPDSSNVVAATRINHTITWDQREVTLLSWDYSEQQRLMEVQFEVQNRSLDGINNYSYEVMDRDHGYLQVKPVVETDDFVVLHIQNIDPNWKELSLRLNLSDSDTSELKLYTNSEAVTRISDIPTRTLNEYQVMRFENRISGYNELIAELEDQIQELQIDISRQEKDIRELQGQEEFQTDAQIKETEQIISSAETNISNSENQISDLEDQIQEYEERIENTQREMKNYQ